MLDLVGNDIVGFPMTWLKCTNHTYAAPMAERLRALLLNHSIISPLCLVWVRAPLWPHMRDAKFCLRVCQVVFHVGSPVFAHLLIGPSHELK